MVDQMTMYQFYVRLMYQIITVHAHNYQILLHRCDFKVKLKANLAIPLYFNMTVSSIMGFRRKYY